MGRVGIEMEVIFKYGAAEGQPETEFEGGCKEARETACKLKVPGSWSIET